MKRRDLIRYLETNGCEDKEHTLYINRQTKKAVAVPRHCEIPPGTARAVCRVLGIPGPLSEN
jgi:hypothetical protein